MDDERQPIQFSFDCDIETHAKINEVMNQRMILTGVTTGPSENGIMRKTLQFEHLWRYLNKLEKRSIKFNEMLENIEAGL